MGNKFGRNPGPSSPKRILLVEDEAIVAADESRLLKGEGYAVLIAASAKKAIETVNSGPDAVDLILMDIDLGKGMDGAQAAQAILKEHDIPIVFLSSHTEKEVVVKTEKITSYGYEVPSQEGRRHLGSSDRIRHPGQSGTHSLLHRPDPGYHRAQACRGGPDRE